MYAEFQDIGNVPWQLLIRARTAAELDAAIAVAIVSAVSEVGSRDLAERVVKAAVAGVTPRSSQGPLEATARVAAIDAAAEFEERCGNGLKWPPRPRHLVDIYGDPSLVTVLSAARGLLEAGSDQLRQSLGESLGAAFEL